MLRFFVFIIILFSGCNSHGDGDDNSKKKSDFSRKEAVVKLSEDIKNTGTIQLHELKNGSQIITFLHGGKDFVLKREFSKDVIFHSLNYLNELKTVSFSVIEGDKRGQFFWNPAEDKVYYYYVNDKKGSVEKSESILKNSSLLKYVDGLKGIKPVAISQDPPKIEYLLENEESVFQANTVIAKVSGKKALIPDKDERCIMIAGKDDYDGDGDLDLLVEDVVACGGNCCPNGFYTVSYQDGKFIVSENFNSSWDGIRVEKWKGRLSFIATSVNAGSNTDDYYEVKRRHIMLNGAIKLVESIESKEIEALFNIRSKEFDMKKPEERKIYGFDLDGDGVKETFECKLWSRWGTVMCTVKKGEGVIAKNINGKRIGVLDSKTKGMSDLVVNHYNIYKWDGKKYKEVK